MSPKTTSVISLQAIIPIVVLIVTGIGACLIGWKFQTPIDNLFAWVLNRAKQWITLIKGIAALALAILPAFIQWSELQNRTPTIFESIVLSATAILLVGLCFFDFFLDRGNLNSSSELETLRGNVDKANESKLFYFFVSHAFLKVVGTKASRFQREAHKPSPKVKGVTSHRIDAAHAKLERLRELSAPTLQIQILIQAIHGILHHFLHQIEPHAKLRVVLLHKVGHGLQVKFCWNGVSDDCVASLPSQAKSQFKFAKEARSAAIAAAISGKIVIVPNAMEANNSVNSPFSFCYPDQSSHLQSMIAIPIKQQDSSGQQCNCVLCIDTDQCNFFANDHLSNYEFLRDQISSRLQIELAVEKLFELAK